MNLDFQLINIFFKKQSIKYTCDDFIDAQHIIEFLNLKAQSFMSSFSNENEKPLRVFIV